MTAQLEDVKGPGASDMVSMENFEKVLFSTPSAVTLEDVGGTSTSVKSSTSSWMELIDYNDASSSTGAVSLIRSDHLEILRSFV